MLRLLPRKLRQRLTTVSRPVAVRAQRAWYWQAVGGAVLLSASVAAGLWIYDLGKRFAGGDYGEAQAEMKGLRERIAALESELTQLRGLNDSSEGRLQVERTALGQTRKQLKSLEDENSRLKEELAFFDNLMPGGREDRLSIHRFRVDESGVPGEYRYRLLVMNASGREARDFQGSVQLVVNLQREGAKPIVVTLPEARASADAFKLNFKRVQRVEGMFRVEPDARVRSVQVRVLEAGSNALRATESFTLSQSLS
jgi:hypothetical protein